ncbi:MAG: hypothetical protein ACI97A_000026 [Planctomycetota bacterium]|jgi:hypothetical protein
MVHFSRVFGFAGPLRGGKEAKKKPSRFRKRAFRD